MKKCSALPITRAKVKPNQTKNNIIPNDGKDKKTLLNKNWQFLEKLTKQLP